MNHQTSSSNLKQKDQNFNLENFRIRFIARLGILLGILVAFIPIIYRIIYGISFSTGKLIAISLPFQTLVILVIALEYFLYKKYGPGIVKYSTLVDVLILILFTADWVLIVLSALFNVKPDNPVCFPIASLMIFVGFSWRTLMVTLIVQSWQLKIIAPALTLILTMGYVIHYSPQTIAIVLLSAITQLFSLIVIIYCEDKVKWKMVWANIQKEKWMQVNNFILDSIPENIMILDLKGEPKFISESCKSFLQKCHLPLDTKGFFKKVQELKQQKQIEPDAQSSVMYRIPSEIRHSVIR